jgi:hypothetical protein
MFAHVIVYIVLSILRFGGFFCVGINGAQCAPYPGSEDL